MRANNLKIAPKAQQAEWRAGDSRREFVEDERLRLCLNNRIFFSKILAKFTCKYSNYKWIIGTYHVYKKLSKKDMERCSKLSYFSDKLRKSLSSKCVIYITKELSEDRIPHFHFLVGLYKDEWGCTEKMVNIKNARMWSREWDLGCYFSYSSAEEQEENGFVAVPMYVAISATGNIKGVDIGARQRWFKYGIYQYLMYIFKYSKFDLYKDYYIR